MNHESFVNYVKGFYYGADSLYPKSWTLEQIDEACALQRLSDSWGDGDSFDREMVRDYLIMRHGE